MLMTQFQNSVLVVDDEAIIAELWCLHMATINVEVCGVAATADAAVALAQEHRPAVVLMDVRLRGEKDGIDAALAIHQTVGSKVIFITGSKEDSTVARIQMDHPVGILFKPVTDRQLHAAVRQAMAQ